MANDHAAHGLALQIGDGGTPEAFLTIAQVTHIAGPGFACETIDVTDLDDTWKTYVSCGSADGGEVTCDLTFDPVAAGNHDNILDDLIAKTANNHTLCWPNFTGGRTAAFGAAAVNTGTEAITSNAHGLHTGCPLKVTTDGTMPAPLVSGTIYYAIRLTAGTFQVATTNALACAGTEINLTSQGVGNHTASFGDTATFSAYVTGAVPAGSVANALTGSITFQVNGAVTLT